MSEPREEYFRFIGMDFDIKKAIELFGNKETIVVKTEDFAKHLPKQDPSGQVWVGMVAIDYKYVKTLERKDPVIVAECCYDNGDKFAVLIDGNHRMYKALWIDKVEELDAIYLTMEETLKIARGPVTQWMEKFCKKETA